MRVQTAEFELSAPGLNACPDDGVPEIAFIGRSNVGKSSLLNVLTNKKGLARVSQTPGCTQLINFFRINGTVRFVDLPGFGYAKVPKGHRAAFEDLIAGYLAGRANLCTVVVLVDSRLDPQRIDLEFLTWLHGLGRDFAVAFTKIDKLKPARAQRNANVFLEALGEARPPGDAVFLTSSESRAGKAELLGFLGKKAVSSTDKSGNLGGCYVQP